MFDVELILIDDYEVTVVFEISLLIDDDEVVEVVVLHALTDLVDEADDELLDEDFVVDDPLRDDNDKNEV